MLTIAAKTFLRVTETFLAVIKTLPQVLTQFYSSLREAFNTIHLPSKSFIADYALTHSTRLLIFTQFKAFLHQLFLIYH
jgi:hypothetical protein